jgi:hypothetical protein
MGSASIAGMWPKRSSRPLIHENATVFATVPVSQP